MPYLRHIQFCCFIILASFLLYVGIMVPGTSFAKSSIRLQSTSAANSWSIVSSPNQGTSDAFSGVAAVSTSNIWAVGYFKGNGAYQTLTEHWNGASWSIVTSPNQVGSGDNYLYSVTAVSANDIWAVGDYSKTNVQKTLIEHWNGTSWSVVASPNQGSFSDLLSAVVRVPGSSNLWTVGHYAISGLRTSTLTEFYG